MSRIDEGRELVLAKLAAPSLPYDHVVRPRLHSFMRKALFNRAIVIAAPPGSGKTTFMRELQLVLEQDTDERFNTAWLSADASDSHPVRFWTHFIKALEQAYRSVFFESAPMQKNMRFEQLTALSNDIFEAAATADRQVIFIDDFDCIRQDDQDELLRFAFNCLTDSSCLVISCDKVPSLLSDFRFASKTYVLEPKALAFSIEETSELLESIFDRPLSAETAEQIHALSDGSPMGICLLADYYESTGVYCDRMLDNISGGSRIDGFFGSYLGQGNLSRLYDAMLSLSLCDSVCIGLCNAMIGHNTGRDTLDALSSLNLLLPDLERGKGWYRFQPLLRYWLRVKLAEKGDAHVLDLVRKASAWFKGRSYEDESAKLLLIGNDAGFLENLAATAGFDRPYREDGFLTWACSVDAASMSTMLYPSLYVTWSYYLTADALNVRKWLESFRRAAALELDDGLGSNHRRMVSQMADFIEIKCRQFEGRYDGTIEELYRFLEIRDDLQPVILCLVYQALGEAHERAGEFDGAYADYLHADALAETASLEFYRLFSRYTLAWLHVMRSAKLDLAYETAQRALEECPPEYSVCGALTGLMAYTQIERFELDEAEANIARAIGGLSLSRSSDIWLEEQVIKARLQAARRNYDEAYRTIVAATVSFEDTGVSRGELCFAYVEQARIDIARGDFEDAKATVAKLMSVSESADLFYSLKISLIRSEIIGLENASNEVLLAIDDIIEQAERHSFSYFLIDAYISKALACSRAGEKGKCFTSLFEALRLSAPIGAINPFARHGTPIVPLLHDIASSRRIGRVERAFARKILAVAFDADGRASVVDERVSRAHLTTREFEILALLNTGLARQEIAERLGVSPNTVKTHIGNIYSKLGVNNRSEVFAVSRMLNR